MINKFLLMYLLSFAFGIASADVYMDMGDSLFSTTTLLGGDRNDGQERYLIINGVPITTKAIVVEMTPLEVIDEIYKNKIQEYNSSYSADDNASTPSDGSPFVLLNDEWSAIFRVNSNQILQQVEQNANLNVHDVESNNYIIMAKKSSAERSSLYELKFNHALDMFKMLLAHEGDVDCNEVDSIKRYPSSRRKFCMIEITSQETKSHIVIYEGVGDPTARISHYKDELMNLKYQVEVIKNISPDRSIIFAKNEVSNLTVFTYKSNDLVLDVIQSQF